MSWVSVLTHAITFVTGYCVACVLISPWVWRLIRSSRKLADASRTYREMAPDPRSLVNTPAPPRERMPAPPVWKTQRPVIRCCPQCGSPYGEKAR